MQSICLDLCENSRMYTLIQRCSQAIEPEWPEDAQAHHVSSFGSVVTDVCSPPLPCDTREEQCQLTRLLVGTASEQDRLEEQIAALQARL